MFSPYLESFLPFSSNLKLSSAIAFSLEGSKIYRLGKGLEINFETRLKLARSNYLLFTICLISGFSSLPATYTWTHHIITDSHFQNTFFTPLRCPDPEDQIFNRIISDMSVYSKGNHSHYFRFRGFL